VPGADGADRGRRPPEHHRLRRIVGGRLEGITGLADLELVLRAARGASLLDRVRDLVSEEKRAVARARVVLARAHVDVLTDGIRSCADGVGSRGSRTIGVDRHAAEIGAERLLEAPAQLAGKAVARSGGSALEELAGARRDVAVPLAQDQACVD